MRAPLKTRAFDLVYHVIVGTIYTYALCLSVLGATVLNPPDHRLFLYCVGAVILFTLLFSHRRVALVSLGLLLLLCLWVTWRIWRGTLDETWLRPLLALVEDLALFAQGLVDYRAEFNQAVELWLAIAFGLVTVLNTQIHFGFYVLCAAAVAVLGVPVFMEEWGHSEQAVVLMVFCFLAMFARKLYQSASNAESVSRAKYALLLLPLSALVFWVSWQAPKPDTETVTEWTESAQSFFSEMSGALSALPSPSRNQSVVFSEDNASLGGPAGLNDELVMEVEADERVYLSGSIRDTYTGSGWTASNPETVALSPSEGNRYDTLDQSESLRAALEYYMRYYAQPERQVTVTMNARSRMVFSPLFRSETSFSEAVSLQKDSYGALSGERTLPGGIRYTHSYISWDYTSVYIQALLRGGAAPDGTGLSAESLAPYLALPEALPARVRELAEQLAAPYSTDYDRLKIIEVYLARSYPYTLEPSPVPAGEDFVDYFLFTGKEGYCVYYASAMAVMARAVGIPTRYIEGYVMPDEQQDGVYAVTNQQAHAWVEAYIDGFGWVRFEPTAAYYPGDSAEMELPALFEEPEPEEPEPEPESQPEESEPEPEPEDPEPEPEEPEPTQKEGGRWWLVLLLIPLLGGGGYLAVRHLSRRYESRQQALGALPNREAVIALFGAILGASDSLGLPIRRGETPLAYADRVGEILSFSDHPDGIAALADIFSKAAYSQNEVSAYERGLTESCYFELTSRLRESRGARLRFLLDRYLLLKY